MSPHPDVVALAGDLLPYSLIYKTGSHQFGLDTPESDIDWTVIYHHPEDHRRLFREHPESQHSEGNDHKMYSLSKFALLCAKGNPNVVELAANLECEPVTYPYNGSGTQVIAFIQAVRPYLVTRHLLAAYVGHITGINAEMGKRGITPKRLSHGIRMAACGLHLIKRPDRVPHFRYSAEQALAFDIKTEYISIEEGEAVFHEYFGKLLSHYQDAKPNLPDGSVLKAAINEFFVRL